MPQPANECRHLAHLILAAALFVIGIAAIVLYRFPPEAYAFYPTCPIHQYLHLECPGCGTTRALAALMHGHLREALRWNALTVGLVLPMVVFYGALSYVRALRGSAVCWPKMPAPAVYAGTGVILVFTILRNL